MAPQVDSVSLPLESAPIKARITIGPISLDVEDVADKLTLLVTKIVESFLFKKIITSTGEMQVQSEPMVKS